MSKKNQFFFKFNLAFLRMIYYNGFIVHLPGDVFASEQITFFGAINYACPQKTK